MSEDRIEKMLCEAKDKLPTIDTKWDIPQIADECYGNKNVGSTSAPGQPAT